MRNWLLILPLLLLGCTSLPTVPLTTQQIESKLQQYKDAIEAKDILLEGIIQEHQKMQGPILDALQDTIKEIEAIKVEDRSVEQRATLIEVKDRLRLAKALIIELEQIKKLIGVGLTASKARLASLEQVLNKIKNN